MPAAGKRDRRIRLEHDAGVLPDGVGQPTPDWQLLEEVWAQKTEMTARETAAATQIKAERTTTFEIGYREDISADMRFRVVYRGRAFDIQAAAEGPERRRTLVLTCIARAE